LKPYPLTPSYKFNPLIPTLLALNLKIIQLLTISHM
jgi:hypothetical protein